jgi:OmcA/MtrC family decaheme c-type cytochrome
VRADQVHVVPALEAATKFQYELVSVTNTAPNQLPAVTVKVVDPTNNNAPYDLLDTTDPANPFRQPSSRLRVQLAWQSVEFNNTGLVWTGTPGQPLTVTLINNGVPTAGLTPNADGSFTLASTVPIPAAAAGSGMASVEGKPYVELIGSGEGEEPGDGVDVVPVDSVSKAFAITDATAVTRRSVVDINKCNDCHKPLAIHGDARVNNTLLCSSCHNPSMVANATLGNADPANAEGTVDLKHMVHALHNGSFATKTDDYGFNQGSEYPGRLNNCEGCHLANTYYPLDPATTQGSSMLAGTDRNSFDDDVAMTPTVSVCAACHVGNVIDANRAEAAGQPVLDAAAAHMLSEGGSFNAGKNAAGLVDTSVETCEICHGQGRSVDVKVEHKVAEFRFN